MRKREVRPDSVTYTILISGSCRMSKYAEALGYFSDMNDLNIPLTNEVYSSVIIAYSKQGQVTEAESMFNQMKMAGCSPDVFTYTSMLHAYNASENWGKACELFLGMEASGIHPDSVACSALMRAFNRGGQPSKVLVLAESMQEKGISFNNAVFFEILSACIILQDWKTTIDLFKLMEPSLPSFSIGLMNQILHLLGKSGKVEAMMKIFYKIIASGVEVNYNTYSVLLEHLLAVGNWRKYIEVLQWMDDAGIQPSNHMFRDIIFFGERSAGVEYAAVIREKVESLRKK